MFTLFKKIKYVNQVYLLVMLFIPTFLFAQVMQSSNYKIEFDSLNTAGVLASSTNYKIEDTAGENATGDPSSTSYNLKSGYQQKVVTVPANVTVTPTITPTSSTGGGVNPDLLGTFKIIDISVVPTYNSAIVVWTTSKPSNYEIAWGKTEIYELGVVSELTNKIAHAVKIENLSPLTRYFFNIELVDSFGTKLSLQGQKFSTISAPLVALSDTLPPSNVSNLQIKSVDENIVLDWKNSTDVDFEFVRVVRSNLFYPNSPFDGDVVYEGLDEKIFDTKPKKGETYYYTVFSKNIDGNYSSGVIVDFVIQESSEPVVVILKDPFEDLPLSPKVNPELEKLTLLDFSFTQNKKKISFSGKNIDISPDENLKISVDYDKFPEVLKTIGITLKDPKDENKVLSFLLRVNKDKTVYEAVIAPLENIGRYTMGISVIDFKNQITKKIEGDLSASTVFPVLGIFKKIDKTVLIGFSIFLSILLILMIVIKFRRV